MAGANNEEDSSQEKQGRSRQNPQRRARFTPEHKILLSILVQARRDAGITQVQLAQKLDKVQSHVAYVETGGRDLTGVEIWRWCEICGLDFIEFARKLSDGIRAYRLEGLEEKDEEA